MHKITDEYYELVTFLPVGKFLKEVGAEDLISARLDRFTAELDGFVWRAKELELDSSYGLVKLTLRRVGPVQSGTDKES